MSLTVMVYSPCTASSSPHLPCIVLSRSRSLFGGYLSQLLRKGDERSDGKGRKIEAFSLFPSHHSPLAFCPRSHHTLLALLAGLQLSRFSHVPYFPLSLEKTCGGARPPPLKQGETIISNTAHLKSYPKCFVLLSHKIKN